jgi:hypothetical protein
MTYFVDRIPVELNMKKLATAMEISQTREGFISYSLVLLRAVIYLSRSLPHIQGRVLLSNGNKKTSQRTQCVQNLL